MVARTLRCAIEEVVGWYPRLFLDPYAVAFAAVAERYSASPACFEVECENVASHWLRGQSRFALEVSWSVETARNAERLRPTMQAKPLVELAAVALALVLARRVLALGALDVTDYGASADYRAARAQRVLEISGTETVSELGRRHREKVQQALRNPFGWDASVVVCAFSPKGHRVRISHHRRKELGRGEEKG
jgi:hypothetical protein